MSVTTALKKWRLLQLNTFCDDIKHHDDNRRSSTITKILTPWPSRSFRSSWIYLSLLAPRAPPAPPTPLSPPDRLSPLNTPTPPTPLNPLSPPIIGSTQPPFVEGQLAGENRHAFLRHRHRPDPTRSAADFGGGGKGQGQRLLNDTFSRESLPLPAPHLAPAA